MAPTLNTQNPTVCMEALQLAGKIIMENGGETYRAEETICRMGEGFGLREVESIAVPSGLFISYRAADDQLETSVKRVRRQGRNLTRVDEANRVSRMVSAGQMSCEEAYRELQKIETMPGPFQRAWGIAAAFLCAAGFAALFGGMWLDLAIAGAAAAVVQAVSMLMEKAHMKWLASAIFGGFLTALLPHLVKALLPGLQADVVIAGAVMPLVPGLAITNAVQDAMRGDMVSGLSHGAQALLTACLIAGGALLSFGLLRLIGGGGF